VRIILVARPLVSSAFQGLLERGRTLLGASAPKPSEHVSSESPDSSRRVAEIRANLDRRAWRTLRARLIQFPPALVLVGGLIFAMAAGGAFHHHLAPYASHASLHDATSSRAGGILGLKIDAVLTGCYLFAVLLAYAVRRLSAPRRARRALASGSVV